MVSSGQSSPETASSASRSRIVQRPPAETGADQLVPEIPPEQKQHALLGDVANLPRVV